ncbi:MAG: hypothetical protein GY805_39430 [Chloroflexi bacterium]|nr:hypothetical protein [Chloroflexota bacterium]
MSQISFAKYSRLSVLMLIFSVTLVNISYSSASNAETTLSPLEITKLLASDGNADDQFGSTVTISGDLAVVGAQLKDSAVDDSGSAYLFGRNQGSAESWELITKFTADTANLNDQFGFATAIIDQTIFIGSPKDDEKATDAGAVYLFEQDVNGAWVQVRKLMVDDANVLDNFGMWIAISGDTAVIGAPVGDGQAVDSGAAYVFERNEGGLNNWGQVAKLFANDGANYDRFGWSVDVSGDTVVVGARWDDDHGSWSGSAYIFERNEGGLNNWGQVEKLRASDATGDDWFGVSVAIDNDTIVVAASQEDTGAIDAGSAYVFERDEGGLDNWGEVTKILNADPGIDDRFGEILDLDGDIILIGSHQNDDAGNNAGTAYVFSRHEEGTNRWGQSAKLTASDAMSDDRFGKTVAIDENTAIIGARWDDAPEIDSGSAYIFELFPLPEFPIELTAVPGYASVQLNWTPSDDATVTEYRLLRGADNEEMVPIILVNDTAYLDIDPSHIIGVNYCYQIEAIDAESHIVATSNVACAVFGTTKLWIPNARAISGQTAIVPLKIRNAEGLQIAASDIWLEFDSSVIEPIDVIATPLTQGYTWAYSVTDVAGKPDYQRIQISAFSSTPLVLHGNGSLFWLKLQVAGEDGDETPLDLREFITGVGGSTIYTPDDLVMPIPMIVHDGTFSVASGHIFGDLSGNGVIEAVDAYTAMQIATGKVVPSAEQESAGDVNGNGRIDAADATMIFYFAVHGEWPAVVNHFINSYSSFVAHTNSNVDVWLNDISGAPGENVETSLQISNLSDWAGGKFTIAYNPNLIDHVSQITVTDLAQDFALEYEDNGIGLLTIALIDDVPVSGSGRLVTISLQIASDAPEGSVTPLVLAEAHLNDLVGRDFATSALQQTISRSNGKLLVNYTVHLPMIVTSE